MNTLSDMKEIEKAFSIFGYKHNINNVTEFHNQMFIGINRAISNYEESLQQAKEEKEISNLKHTVNFYENYMTDNLRNFTLVMHLSNFEEISVLVCKDEGVTTPNSSSIGRFKMGWEAKLSKPLGVVPAWCTITEAAKIRNAVLHAAGRISLNRDKENIERIIRKENLKKQGDRVYITEQFLNKVKDAIWEITK